MILGCKNHVYSLFYAQKDKYFHFTSLDCEKNSIFATLYKLEINQK